MEEATVKWRIVADPGSPFNGLVGTVQFESGDENLDLIINVPDIPQDNPQEDFQIVLDQPINAILGETTKCNVSLLNDKSKKIFIKKFGNFPRFLDTIWRVFFTPIFLQLIFLHQFFIFYTNFFTTNFFTPIFYFLHQCFTPIFYTNFLHHFFFFFPIFCFVFYTNFSSKNII